MPEDEGSPILDPRPSPLHPEPDPHGQAALILAESILHALIEVKTFTAEEAVELVEAARTVKVDMALETHESRGTMQKSLDLLVAIERSLLANL